MPRGVSAWGCLPEGGVSARRGVCTGEGVSQHTMGQTPPGQTHPHGQTLLQCMLGYGPQAGGTHPTDMHSCL